MAPPIILPSFRTFLYFCWGAFSEFEGIPRNPTKIIQGSTRATHPDGYGNPGDVSETHGRR